MNPDDRDEPMKPHPEKSKLVVRGFQLYSQGGMAFDRVADQLRRQGYVYRPSTPRVSPGRLSYMLADRLSIGDIAWKGNISGYYLRSL